MTPPSIGQVVHYRSRGSADGIYPPLCRAAIVTRVEDPDPEYPGDTFVALAVINPTGMFFDEMVIDDQTEMKLPGSWHWACKP